jgi:hypothetical protein
MTRRVTTRRLVKASNALLELTGCVDFEDKLQSYWHARNQEGVLARWQMDALPTYDSVLATAQTLSILAAPDEEDD